MKLSLVVLTPGKSQGKSIPVGRGEFVIGRDPDCQLRPASAAISRRHCALKVNGDKAYLNAFESPNGTWVNDRQVRGEVELCDGDRLKVGPLEFTVRVEGAAPAKSVRTVADSDTMDDAAAAAALLALDSGASSSGNTAVDEAGVPSGSTVFEIPPAPAPDPRAEEKKKPDKPKAPAGDTKAAAQRILDMYLKRRVP